MAKMDLFIAAALTEVEPGLAAAGTLSGPHHIV